MSLASLWRYGIQTGKFPRKYGVVSIICRSESQQRICPQTKRSTNYSYMLENNNATNSQNNFVTFCRKFATENKYDIHNPYSEETPSDNEQKTEIVQRKPAGYFSSLFQVWRTPAPAFLTGIAGLVPFVAAPSYLYFIASSFHPFLISAQLAYGAIILSFIGGIRWGFVIPYRHGSTHMVTWRGISWSCVPALMAWGGILLPDLTGGLLMVSVGLLVSLYNDLRLFGDYPKWMLGLRCLLTTVAVVTLIASVILVEENRMKNTFGRRTPNKILDKDI
ncbi:transmembrane protein 69-like [Styela clava]